MIDEQRKQLLSQILGYRGALRRYLRKFTVRADEVDDLVQEAYVRVCAMPAGQVVESPRALIFRIARNLAVDRARQVIVQATDAVADFEALNVVTPVSDLVDQLDADRRFEAFCAVVDELPPICRRVFILRKVYQLSHDEIAEVLGMAHSTIEKHVTKGLLRCRSRLRELGALNEPEAETLWKPSDEKSV